MINTLKLVKHLQLAEIFSMRLGLCMLVVVLSFQMDWPIIATFAFCVLLLAEGIKKSIDRLKAYKQSLQKNQLAQEDLDKQSKF